MRMVDLIEKKKLADVHDTSEIRFIVNGYTAGEIPDYQMAAWLMAVRFHPLNRVETVDLTLAMAESGRQLDLSGIDGVKVDKHSTGGVADTTTLIVTPLVAAAGVKVAKMSGRGLGFTGGTIDKLESIPGFRTSMSSGEFIEQIRRVGMAIISQTPDIAPADGKIYALRDVTATVDSLPLIAASVMSKKIAAGADKILLDVKFGSGAFMKTLPEAIELAQVMVDIGTGTGRETVAMLSSMEEPLGTEIGNSREVAEAIEVLSGNGDSRLRDFCLAMAARMVVMAKPELGPVIAAEKIRQLLTHGAGLAKLREFIEAQGGDGRVVSAPELLGNAACALPVYAQVKGFIGAMDSAELGRAAILLGAGREKKGDAVDLTAGIKIHKRCGEAVDVGEVLATLHYNFHIDPAPASRLVLRSVQINESKPRSPQLIAGIVDLSGWQAFA
jgi:pyrimidine-nucleoside phosphorylase